MRNAHLAREQAAEVILDNLKHDRITVGQARNLLCESGWKPGPAHFKILTAVRISVLKPLEPQMKKAAQSATRRERKIA